MAEVTLTPRVRLTNDIEGKGAELAASNLAKLRKRLALNIVANLLRVPARLGITKASLAIDAEAPLVEITTFGEGSCVAEASRARLNADLLALIIRRELNLGGHLDNLSLSNT